MTSVFLGLKDIPFAAPQRTISSTDLDAIADVSSTISPVHRIAISSA